MSLLGSIGSALITVGSFVLAIAVLLLMITIHELGHYTAGKLLKFKIVEFSVGFGKAIFSKQTKSGEKVSLRVFPLGGYCAFVGEEEAKNEATAGSFNAEKPWKRLIVFFAGAFFNFVSAALLCVALLAVIGTGITQVSKVGKYEAVPGDASSVVKYEGVEKLEEDDIILKVNGQTPSFFNQGVQGIVSELTHEQDITLVVERNGQQEELVVRKTRIRKDGKYEYVLMINQEYVPLSVGEAFAQAVPFAANMAWECLKLLGQLVTGQLSLQNVGGPVTVVSAIADASSVNLLNLLLIIPLIAVNLAVFNLLPIPALDGARMIFVLIEWIRKKPINRELENKIHTIGLVVLMGFMVILELMHLFVF